MKMFYPNWESKYSNEGNGWERSCWTFVLHSHSVTGAQLDANILIFCILEIIQHGQKQNFPQWVQRSLNDCCFNSTNPGSKGHSVFAVTLHDSSCKSVPWSAALRSTLPRGLWASRHIFRVCSETTLLDNLSESSPMKSRLKGLEIHRHHLSETKLFLPTSWLIEYSSATNGNGAKCKNG